MNEKIHSFRSIMSLKFSFLAFMLEWCSSPDYNRLFHNDSAPDATKGD
jgi:hypothetical protein